MKNLQFNSIAVALALRDKQVFINADIYNKNNKMQFSSVYDRIKAIDIYVIQYDTKETLASEILYYYDNTVAENKSSVFDAFNAKEIKFILDVIEYKLDIDL